MKTTIVDLAGDKLSIEEFLSPDEDRLVLIECIEEYALLDAAGVEALIADLTARLAAMRAKAGT